MQIVIYTAVAFLASFSQLGVLAQYGDCGGQLCPFDCTCTDNNCNCPEGYTPPDTKVFSENATLVKATCGGKECSAICSCADDKCFCPDKYFLPDQHYSNRDIIDLVKGECGGNMCPIICNCVQNNCYCSDKYFKPKN